VRDVAWVNWWVCWWRKSANFSAWKAIIWWLCCCTCWPAVVALHVAISTSRQGGGGCCNNQPAHRRKCVFSIPPCRLLPPPTRRMCSEVAYPRTTYSGQALPVQCPQPSSQPTQAQCYHANASVLAYSESTNVVVSAMVHVAWASHAADIHVPLHHHQTPCTQMLRQLGLIVGWIET
jgi:hypothetical protein